MSPTNAPGGGPPDGAHEEWQRRQRATVRRPRRADSAGRRIDDSDPNGWSAVRDGGVDYPPGAPGDDPRGGRARGERGRAEPAVPEQWQADPGYMNPGMSPGYGGPGPAGPGHGDPRRGDPGPMGMGRADPPWDDPRRDDPRRAEASWGNSRPEDGRGMAGPPPGGGAGQPPRGDQAGEPPREGGRRSRGPHRRRAVEGQATGLTTSMQSDLPSWLQERGEGMAPVNRLLSLSVAGFAGLLGLAVVLGAYTGSGSYGLVIFGVQVLFVLAWTVTIRPAGPRVVAGVSLATAAGADLAAALPTHASLAPIGLVTVGAVGAAVAGQLLRPSPRPKVTESLGSTLIVVIGVVCFAMLIVLGRHAPGTPSIVACLTAAGVALVVARLADTVFPSPRTSPQVPRGSIGVVLGAMVGTVAAGVMGSVLVGLDPKRTAVAGLATALVAVLVDLAVSYAEVSRELDGQPQALWIARHLQGPLGGFALASPVAYVLSVMLLVTNLN